ncbi:MAG TPA: hypothetical protein VFX85_07895 [Solirubrobacterales bacterium]|nr:hypothetical protein [Solirubrobacterales bacterium]
MSVRRSVLLTALAAALALALLPAASASAKTYKTGVVVSLKVPAFHGNVTSKRGSCLGGRKVKLYRSYSGSTTQLGQDTTNAKGKWSIPVKPLSSGAYFAKVSKKGNCKSGKSQILAID